MKTNTKAIAISVATFFSGLVLSCVIAWQLDRLNTQRITQAADSAAHNMMNELGKRIQKYEYGLRGARGAVITAHTVNLSRQLFEKYSLTRDLEKEFPGARGFGFIRRVAEQDEAKFLAEARLDGEQNFGIKQLSPHAGDRYVIQYIEPLEKNSAAVGLDIASEANRRIAAEAAMRTGQAQLTGPITLVQLKGNPLQSFLMLLPIYIGDKAPITSAERERALLGWSYAPLVIHDVLNGLVAKDSVGEIVIDDVTSPSKVETFYRSNSANLTTHYFYTTKVKKPVYGRLWELRFSVSSAFVNKLHLPSISAVLTTGTVISALIALIIGSLLLQRQRAQKILATQAQLASIVESSIDGIIGVDLHGTINSWNRGAENIFGFNSLHAVGKNVENFIFFKDRLSQEKAALASVARGEAISQALAFGIRQDDYEISISASIAPVRNAVGLVVGASITVRDTTEQIKAEVRILELNSSLEQQVVQRTAQLELARRNLQTILDAAPSLIGYWDKNLVNQVANRAYHEWLGMELGTLPGTHILELMGENSFEMYRETIEAVLRGEPQRFNTSFARPDGTHHVIANYLPDIVEGEVLGYYVVAHDVTDITETNQRLEKALDHNHELLATINQQNLLLTNVLKAASEISIVATDLDGTITMFNSGAERMLGYTSEEIVGKTTPALFHRGDEVINRSEVLSVEYGMSIQGFRVFVHVPELAGSETQTWTYIRKDGSELQVSLIATAMRDTEGRLIGYLGIATDVTDALAQEGKLQSALNQLGIAADVAELGIWSWVLDDNSIVWNDRMYEMYSQPLSLREEGLYYRHWYERVHPDDVEQTAALLAAAVEGRAVYDPVFRVLSPDGQVRYIKAAAQIEHDKLGRPVKVTGINRDITQQLVLEAELITEKEKAYAASAAKSSFLANMSHEIRTPMNAVLGMLQLLQQTALTDRQRDYLDKGKTAAKSLLGLLNDILDFSKIDAGKLTLEVHSFEFEALLRDLGVILSSNQGTKNVEILFDLDPRVPNYLVGDLLRLQQVLINLAGNALKFTHEGHVLLRTQLIRHNAQECRIQIGVMDTGIGITPDQLTRIFEGFVQAEASTTRRFGGTGLGLVISKKLVELMGGTLNVESSPGIGSHFWFEVDLALQDKADNCLVQPVLKPMKVLVADDNELCREILMRTINSFGWQAEGASGGLEAVEKVRMAQQQGEGFDVVLMDWRMPDLDGKMAAEHIHNDPSMLTPPVVIMVTAFAREELISQDEAVYQDLLTKPVTPQQLYQAINRVMNPALLEEPKPVELAPERPLSGLKLLVVEDNELNRQVAAELLTGEGAEVVLAEGGLEGVAQVNRQPGYFHLVIMDMQMPDIDGLEATRRIRANPECSLLPILAMTANASTADREACLSAGMNDHVSKPFDIGELVPKILGLTQGHSLPATEKPDATPPEMDSYAQIMGRFGGRRDLLERLLVRYEPDVSKLLDTLEFHAHQNDVDGEIQALHSLRGLASTMGASALAARAGYLERSLKAAPQSGSAVPLDHSTLGELHALFQSSLAALRKLVMTSPDTQPKAIASHQALSPAAWRECLLQILVLLEADNLHAVTKIEELYSLSPVTERGKLNDLLAQANALEYQKAMSTLKNLLSDEA